MQTPQFALWPLHNSPEEATADLARNIAAERSDKETPFYIIDLDDIKYKIDLWREVLPRIRPHYGK